MKTHGTLARDDQTIEPHRVMLKILQNCRGVAAIAVCAFHASILFSAPRYGGHAIFGGFTALGYLGVDFFFGLSGFIIFFVHHRDIEKPAALPGYLAKRFVRIYPLYWLVTVAVLAGAGISHGTSTFPESFNDFVSMLSLVHFNDFARPVNAAWTLYHEVFFYLVFSTFFLSRNLGIFLGAAWLAIIFFGHLHNTFHQYGDFANLVAAPVNIAFLGGIAAYFLYRTLNQKQGIFTFFSGAFSLLLVLTLADSSTLTFKFLLAASFMLIISGLCSIEKSGLILKLPVLKAIGDASFALYLTHENIQSIGLKIIFRTPFLRSMPVEIDYLLLLLLSVGLSLCVYRYLERPLLIWLRKYLVPQLDTAAETSEIQLDRNPESTPGRLSS